jgi:1,4-alpha-glucan branching enzyme
MINKMPGYEVDKFANLKCGYLFMFGHAGKKLLFMGQDFGQKHEWDEKVQLSWEEADQPYNKDLQNFMKDLLHLYKKYPAFYAKDDSWDGFQWVNADDADRSIYSFIRRDGTGKNNLLFVINMTPMERKDYMVGVPHSGKYTLILDKDGALAAGSGKKTSYSAAKGECDHQPYRIEYELPAYGCAVFKFND